MRETQKFNKNITWITGKRICFFITAPYLGNFTLDAVVPNPDACGFGALGVSVLASGTQVCGFKPSRSCRIFKGEKILSTPSFGGEVKPSVPCCRFAACKRSLNVAWKSTFRQNYRTTFSPTVPTSAAGISHVVADVEAPGGEKWERLKKKWGKAMANYP